MLGGSLQNGLDIDNGGSVDGLDWTDTQTVALDGSHGHRVKPQWVRPVWRARRKDPRERIVRVRPRMHLEHRTIGFVQPRDDDDVVMDRQTQKSLGGPRVHL